MTVGSPQLWRVGDRVRLVEPIGWLKADTVGLVISVDPPGGEFAGVVAFPAIRDNPPVERGAWVDGIRPDSMPNPNAIPIKSDEVVYVDNMLDGDNCKVNDE